MHVFCCCFFGVKFCAESKERPSDESKTVNMHIMVGYGYDSIQLDYESTKVTTHSKSKNVRVFKVLKMDTIKKTISTERDVAMICVRLSVGMQDKN